MAGEVNLAPNVQLYDFGEGVGNRSPLIPRIVTITVPTQSHCPFFCSFPDLKVQSKPVTALYPVVSEGKGANLLKMTSSHPGFVLYSHPTRQILEESTGEAMLDKKFKGT